MKLIDMKLSKAERKSESPMAMPESKPSGPEYPYGLSISLDERSLSKLGDALDGAESGDYVTLACYCCVKEVVDRKEDRDGKKKQDRRVELQIEKMAVKESEMSEEQADKTFDRYMKDEE